MLAEFQQYAIGQAFRRSCESTVASHRLRSTDSLEPPLNPARIPDRCRRSPTGAFVQQSVARLPGATFFGFRRTTKAPAFSGVFLCGMMFDLAEDAESDDQLKMVRQILSGGQTGADRAGLDFAIHAGPGTRRICS
jgi:hypothetical protein